MDFNLKTVNWEIKKNTDYQNQVNKAYQKIKHANFNDNLLFDSQMISQHRIDSMQLLDQTTTVFTKDINDQLNELMKLIQDNTVVDSKPTKNHFSFHMTKPVRVKTENLSLANKYSYYTELGMLITQIQDKLKTNLSKLKKNNESMITMRAKQESYYRCLSINLDAIVLWLKNNLQVVNNQTDPIKHKEMVQKYDRLSKYQLDLSNMLAETKQEIIHLGIIILANKQLIDCIQNTVDKSIDLWFDQARLILKMSSQAEKKRVDEELHKINSEIVNAQLNQVKDKINQVQFDKQNNKQLLDLQENIDALINTVKDMQTLATQSDQIENAQLKEIKHLNRGLFSKVKKSKIQIDR